MLIILQNKIAFADWVKENVLNKIATRFVYNGNKKKMLKIRNSWHFRLESHTWDTEHDVVCEKHD